MKYEYWMARIQGVPVYKKIRLRECMKSAEAIYYIEEIQLQKIRFLNENERNKIMQAQKNIEFSVEYEKMLEKSIRFVPYFSDEYPKQLREIPDFPYAIYVKGRLPGEEQKNVALIGARALYAVWREICYRFCPCTGGMRCRYHKRNGEGD